MTDVLSALTPPAVVGGAIIAFVVWLFRTQRADKEDQYEAEQDTEATGEDPTKP